MRKFGQLGVHFGSLTEPSQACHSTACNGFDLAARLASKPLDLLAVGDKHTPAFHAGFSEAVEERGFGLDLTAEVYHNIMVRLGHTLRLGL